MTLAHKPLPSALLLALAPLAGAQSFGPETLLPGDMALGGAAGNQEVPSIAAGDSRYLAVWEDQGSSLVDSVFGEQAFGSSVPGNIDIVGMLLDGNGAPLLPAPVVIDGGSWDQREPEVAWNGSEYLVVYEGRRVTGASSSDAIFGVRVSATGQVLDLDPIVIRDRPGLDETLPTVASIGGTWLVAWMGFSDTGSAITEGAVVQADGTPGPPRLLTGALAGYATSPALGASGSSYALAFSVSYGQAVKARVFDAAGAPLTPVVTLHGSQGNHPAVAGSDTEFLVTWTGAGIRGTTLLPSGTVGTPDGRPLSTGGLASGARSSVAWDGTDFLVAYVASTGVAATRVDRAGQVQLAQFPVTSGGSGQVSDARVAALPGTAQVAWTDRGVTGGTFGIDPFDIRTSTVLPDGSASPSRYASLAPPAQFDPRIAGDAQTGYLVVFSSWSADSTRILAQRLDASGQALAPPFEVISDPERVFFGHDVAFNGEEFVVTWLRARSLTTLPPPIVEARRCTIDGTLLDPQPIEVMEGAGRPAVDNVGSQFLIAVRWHHASLQSNSEIRARRLDGPTGLFLDSGPQHLDIASGTVDVVGLTDRWFVAYSGIRITPVTAAGQPLPTVFAASTGHGSSVYLRLSPSPDRTSALLSYESLDTSGVILTSRIRMRRFDADLSSPDPHLGPVVNDAPNAQLRPAAAWVGDQALFAWADHRDHTGPEPGLGDVFAARMTSTGLILDQTGVPVADTPAPEGSVDVSTTAGGRALVAYTAIERSGPRGSVHRLRTRAFQGDPIGTVTCTQPTPNASGQRGALQAFGSTVASHNDLHLRASALPPGQLGMFIVSTTPVTIPNAGGSLGTLCVGGSIGRYDDPGQIQPATPSGTIDLTLDLQATPNSATTYAVMQGQQLHFQTWHRDTTAGLPTSNFTNTITLLFR